MVAKYIGSSWDVIVPRGYCLHPRREPSGLFGKFKELEERI